MRRILAAWTIVLVVSSQALAWSDAGHKIIASIAFARLTEAEHGNVIEILQAHPRFKQDFLDQPDDIEAGESTEWLFQQASIWPDMARGFRGADAKLSHSTWHYINLPHFLNDSDRAALGKLTLNDLLDPPAKPEEAMNAIQTIRLARKMLKDPGVGQQERAIMLCWLFHVVGDIHQPLHSSAMFSQKLFRDGDRGGNRVLTKQRGNLHALWDGFPGGKLKMKTAHEEALKLMADADRAALGEKAATQLDEKDWLEESRDLAVNVAYGPDILAHLRSLEEKGATEVQPITLGEEYLKEGGEVSRRRVVQAGYRLGAVLKQIVE